MTGDPVSIAIGRSLHAARTASGLTTRGLAARSRVSQAFVSQVERGQATPSVATLYRMADALGVSPAALLPEAGADDMHYVPAGTGDLVASSDRPASAVGRVVLADRARDLEIYEYRARPSDDLDVWFQHPGDKILFLLEGRLRVDFAGRPSRLLMSGDCLVHPGDVRHRWQVEGDADVRLLLVITRQHDRAAVG